MTNSRWTAKSHWVEPNPRSAFRGRFPWREGEPVVGSIGGEQKAPMLGEPSGHPPATAPGVLLNAFPPGYCDPYKYKGTPAMTSGLGLVLNPFDRLKKFP